MLKENDVDAYTVSEPYKYRSGKKPLLISLFSMQKANDCHCDVDIKK